MPRLSAKQRSEIVARYELGELCPELAAEFGVDRSSVFGLLKRRGATMQSREYIFRKASGHTLDTEAFSLETESARYWLGFLAADGCVQNTTVSLVLSEKDSWHLSKFRQFMGGSQKFVNVERTLDGKVNRSVRYAFQSEKVVNDLALMGIGERKSLSFSVHESFCGCRHFWRGMVDGDGYVALVSHRGVKTARLELCGSEASMIQFSEYVQQLLGVLLKVSGMKSIWRVSAGGMTAARLIDHLYRDAEIALDRKATSAFLVQEWAGI